jgi:hypothetical protein
MGKESIRVRHLLVYLPKQAPWIRWKKAMGTIVITGAMLGGVSGTALAAAPTADHGLYDSTSVAAPRIEQPEPEAVSNKYLLTHIERDRSPGLQSILLGAMTTAATRCPAFVTWEDWGGTRVHAYVDFRPSDLCDGRHVKRAYVRLIRQCGPYYDTGRVYTYTAGSASDTSLYSISAWTFDSPIWSCNTNTYYGYEYF